MRTCRSNATRLLAACPLLAGGASHSAPGSVDFSSSGTTSTQHLAGELLNVMAGIQLVHFPTRAAAPH